MSRVKALFMETVDMSLEEWARLWEKNHPKDVSVKDEVMEEDEDGN